MLEPDAAGSMVPPGDVGASSARLVETGGSALEASARWSWARDEPLVLGDLLLNRLLQERREYAARAAQTGQTRRSDAQVARGYAKRDDAEASAQTHRASDSHGERTE